LERRQGGPGTTSWVELGRLGRNKKSFRLQPPAEF
jgi:hypothetical protein